MALGIKIVLTGEWEIYEGSMRLDRKSKTQYQKGQLAVKRCMDFNLHYKGARPWLSGISCHYLNGEMSSLICW